MFSTTWNLREWDSVRAISSSRLPPPDLVLIEALIGWLANWVDANQRLRLSSRPFNSYVFGTSRSIPFSLIGPMAPGVTDELTHGIGQSLSNQLARDLIWLRVEIDAAGKHPMSNIQYRAFEPDCTKNASSKLFLTCCPAGCQF